ncbi:MAG: VWA domain-containing protein [Myxococcales bacterium]|nr:VWA domain-containing protein [Myxococcales bacterium]
MTRVALVVGLVCVAVSASAQLSDLTGRAWVRVSDPVSQDTEVDLPVVAVSGYAGARSRRGQDLVIVVDVSDSTLEWAGVDLDGDGPNGATDPLLVDWLLRQPDVSERLVERVQEEDFDDSVLMAELAAAYELIDRVDPRLFRVGLVAFSGHAWLVTPLGATRSELIDGLDHLRWNFFYGSGGTDFVDAVRVSAAALDPPVPPDDLGAARTEAPAAEGEDEVLADRAILFLSDGAPTGVAGRSKAEESALAAAREAADRGIRVFTYAIGPQAIQALDVYRGMAELSGGRFEKIERPADAVPALRSVDLTDVAELSVENLTTGGAARAVRLFPDGSFDGMVELSEGANRLRFTALAHNGSQDVAERRVLYAAPENLTAAERLEHDKRIGLMVEELKGRTQETEFMAEMAKRRPPQRRELDVRVDAAEAAAEPDPAAPAVGSGPPSQASPKRR